MAIRPEQWTQLREMFRVAIQHDSPQRAAYLDQACANDPNKPECKDVPKTAAPTLAPEEETTEEPGAEETQEPEAGGETTDPGTTGGEAPSTGGGTGETPAPEAGVPTE